jgi:hypothetical protein
MAQPATAILLVSDREPLAWLLREQRFAVPESRAVSAPGRGTRLLLYTTRGCYRNPTRDRGLIMGIARVVSQPRRLDEPARFRNRDFHVGFGIRVEGVAAPHDGVELGPLAGRLDALPDPVNWRVRMRRTFIPLSVRDAELLVELLRPKLCRRADVLPAYLEACTVTASAAGGAA